MRQLHSEWPAVRGGRVQRLWDASEGYWLSFNVRGNVVYCTQSLARLCGRSAAEILDANVATLLPELAVNGCGARDTVTAMIGYVNGCYRLHLTLADSQTMPVNASITSALVGTGPVFTVALQPAAGGGAKKWMKPDIGMH